MNTQAWYTDREFVTKLLTALVGLYLLLRQYIPAFPDVDPNIVGGLVMFLGALGIFGRVTDKTKPKLGLKTRR